MAIGRSMGDRIHMDDPNMDRQIIMVVQAGMGELEVWGSRGWVGSKCHRCQKRRIECCMLYLEVCGSETALIVEERVAHGG